MPVGSPKPSAWNWGIRAWSVSRISGVKCSAAAVTRWGSIDITCLARMRIGTTSQSMTNLTASGSAIETARMIRYHGITGRVTSRLGGVLGGGLVGEEGGRRDGTDGGGVSADELPGEAELG